MQFASFTFLAMPRGFTAAILASLCLVVTLAREAALGSDVFFGVGCSATTACSTVAPSQTFPALSAGFGVTQKAAGALRGRGTGICLSFATNGARELGTNTGLRARSNGAHFPAAERSAGSASVRVVTRARGFLLTSARGVAADFHDFSECSDSAGRTLAPTAQRAEASMKELSAVTIRRRISAALPYTNTAAAGHTAAANDFPEARRV